MGELGLNKIFGALLAVGLIILGLKEVSMIVFGGGHHYHKEHESLNAWAEYNFKGFRVDIAETGGGGEVIEEIYDLGALILAADFARGERSFKAKCASCHTIDEGGANGTGPNLYATLGAAKQSHTGFSYSGALASTEGDWSWDRMDAWLENPSSYARGTSMAFAGLKRDDERAAMLVYLASYSPDAPEPPAPLAAAPAEGDAEEAAGDLAETDETVIESSDPTAAQVAEDAAVAAEAAADQAIEDAANDGTAAIVDATVAADQVVEAVTETADATIAEATETVEDATAEAAEATETIVEDATPER
ncbi:MAG: c-type cytochrome [Pseudomonadota bacterium]